MRYLINVIDDKSASGGAGEMAAIDAFNDRLRANGHWIFADGITSPSMATVIDNRGKEAVITRGPLLESKEFVSGFWIIEAADPATALKLATEGSKCCNRKVELRPFIAR